MKFSAIFCGQKAEQMQPSSPDFLVVMPFFAITLSTFEIILLDIATLTL